MRNLLALIIEDDEPLSEVISISLQQAGFDTIATHDGQRALKQLHLIVPDLIVLDLHLPNVSGKTILEYIRAEDRLHRIRVFLTTADGFLADELAAKADMVLIKPFRLNQLYRSARQVANNN